jgi:hypothetical protein
MTTPHSGWIVGISLINPLIKVVQWVLDKALAILELALATAFGMWLYDWWQERDPDE